MQFSFRDTNKTLGLILFWELHSKVVEYCFQGEQTAIVNQEDLSYNLAPQERVVPEQLGSKMDTEVSLCTDKSSEMLVSTSKSGTDKEELDCVINTEHSSVKSTAASGEDISSRPKNSRQTTTKAQEEKCSEYSNTKETSTSRKKKVGRYTEGTKKYTKRKKETKMPGMTTMGTELRVKDTLDTGSGFSGLKRLGTSNAYNDETRINSSNILSERFDKLKNANEVAESEHMSQQREKLELLDKELLMENIENKKEVPNIHVHVKVDSMRYEKMGLSPPPPMPQPIIDRYCQDNKAKCLADVESMSDESIRRNNKSMNFEIKPPKFSKETKEKISSMNKGYEDGILALQKTIDDGNACDANQERKLQEIRKTLQVWKEKAAEDEIDEETKRKMMAVTDYVQQILRTKLALKDHKNETTSETVGITNINTSTDMTSGNPEQSGLTQHEKVSKRGSFEEVFKKSEELKITGITEKGPSQVKLRGTEAGNFEVSHERKQKEGNKKDDKDVEIHSGGTPSTRNELQNSSKVKCGTELSSKQKLMCKASHRNDESGKDSRKSCEKATQRHDEGQRRLCKQGKESESLQGKDKNSKDGKVRMHSTSSRNKFEEKSRRNDKKHSKEYSQRSRKGKEGSDSVKETSKENKKLSKDNEKEKEFEKENKLNDGISCEASMKESGNNCTNKADNSKPSNVTVNVAGSKQNVSKMAEVMVRNESKMIDTDDINEHGEADMSLDESFDASTSNIQLPSILDIDMSQRQQSPLDQDHNGNKGGMYNTNMIHTYVVRHSGNAGLLTSNEGLRDY